MEIAEIKNLLGTQLLDFHGPAQLHVSGITADSRKVREGMLFAAVPGTRCDGEAFAAQALAAGAAGIIHHSEWRDFPAGKAFFRSSGVFASYAKICRAFAGFPDRKLKLFGVTGTNGKTTTVYLWKALLSCGMLSTVECFDGKNSVESTHTTPDPETLFALLQRMTGNGLTACGMELSSHALDQNRCGELRFAAAVFTNLTGDHLDYHKTMENCYLAKRRLFTELLLPEGTAVINVDDPYGVRLAKELQEMHRTVWTFGAGKTADYRIEIEDASSFRLNGLRFTGNLIGEHNFHNISGAVLAAFSAGMPLERSAEILSCGVCVPGRLEEIKLPSGASAFVDYAHTDDALKNVLGILRKVTKHKIIAVFGAGGDRDRTKRPRMGRVVEEMADAAIVTSDNPRSEDPERIIDEILAGTKEPAKFFRETDRREAIKLAFRMAGPGDAVLIAGKGHEKTQEIAGVKYPFDDVQTVKELLSDYRG